MSQIHSALIVNCNRNEDVLTLREFVWPIQRSLPVPSRVISLRSLTQATAQKADVIIFSGTTLKDNDFISHARKLSWLRGLHVPMLGICAGQQLLGIIFGGKIVKMKHPAIGVYRIRSLAKQKKSLTPDEKASTFLDSLIFSLFSGEKFASVYGLHGNQIHLPSRNGAFATLASSPSSPHEVVVHHSRPILGVAFHPEVLNKPLFRAFIAWAESFSK